MGHFEVGGGFEIYEQKLKLFCWELLLNTPCQGFLEIDSV
jgi:hypothetical protein